MIRKSIEETENARNDLFNRLNKVFGNNPQQTGLRDLAEKTIGNVLTDDETGESFSFRGYGTHDNPFESSVGAHRSEVEVVLTKLAKQRGSNLYFRFNGQMYNVYPDGTIERPPNSLK